MEHDTGHERIRISESTLRWLGSEYESCFVTLVPDEPTGPEELADAVRAAATDAPGGVVTVTDVLLGIECVHVRLLYGGLTPKREVRDWVQRLADALAEAGVSGVLRRPRAEYPPSQVSETSVRSLAMTVFCAGRRPRDTSVVSRLAASVGLHQFDDHDVRSSGLWARIALTPDQHATFASLDAAFTITGWSQRPLALVSISFIGTDLWDARSSRGDWAEQARRATAGLVALAADVHHAWAERVNGLQDWFGVPRHHPDGISSASYCQNEVVWPSRVIDAHGLQVLTADHLERASSLADWRTTRVGDRFLVEARDLEPWYAADEPDPEVLDRARADFGSMIVTRSEMDAIRAAERQERS